MLQYDDDEGEEWNRAVVGEWFHWEPWQYVSFSSFSCRGPGSVFRVSAMLTGPAPAGSGGVVWQTGPLFNCLGVKPVRLNTVYAFNRPLLPAGLEPGTSPTIPSRQDLPAPSYSPPSTCRQARRFPCMVDYH